jgi:hypothetical protein
MGLRGVTPAVSLLDNYHINDIGSSLALLVGAAILLGTSVVYHLLNVKETLRMELLKRHYSGRSKGELLSIRHNMVEAAQAAIVDIEVVTHLCHQCIEENLNAAECMDRINEGKNRLDELDHYSAELRKYLDDFGNHILEKNE